MRALLIWGVLLAGATLVLAGHTRSPYVDGCQSVDGRFVVTADYDAAKKAWQFTWKDTRDGLRLTGPLVGLKDGQGHFSVTYAHLFPAPDGETFAVWNGGAFAPAADKPPRDSSAAAFRDYAGFADRLVVYRKTGEVVKRLGLKDILQEKEWEYVHFVHANLYWSSEYADADKGNIEAPRAGYRTYRISPDYTILETVIGPCEDLRSKFPNAKRRVVRFRLTDGAILTDSDASREAAKIPVRPFVGELTSRGAGKNYLPSLDPVRVAGTFQGN